MSRGERGEVSLVSVLVACVLLVVVLGATLTLFEGFTAKAGDATRRTDAQDVARTAADRIARDLRNLSSPTPEQPDAVDRASGNDLIFKTVDPQGPNAGTNTTNTKRVRYCLDSSRRLQEQTQTDPIPPAAPFGTACPGSGWTRTTIAATNVVNGAEPVFSYDAAVLTDIAAIHVDLIVDTDIVRLPPATRLATGVFLRNRNRRPTASFAADRTSGGLVLNGSASFDPEGDPLRYAWYDGTTQIPIGTGITYTYTPLVAGSIHQIHLEVSDPIGLVDVSATLAVTA